MHEQNQGFLKLHARTQIDLGLQSAANPFLPLAKLNFKCFE